MYVQELTATKSESDHFVGLSQILIPESRIDKGEIKSKAPGWGLFSFNYYFFGLFLTSSLALTLKSSTSKINVAPPGILGGAPLSP